MYKAWCIVHPIWSTHSAFLPVFTKSQTFQTHPYYNTLISQTMHVQFFWKILGYSPHTTSHQLLPPSSLFIGHLTYYFSLTRRFSRNPTAMIYGNMTMYDSCLIY